MTDTSSMPMMYNHRTGAWEQMPAEITDDNAPDFLPHGHSIASGALRGIYTCRRGQGDTPTEALAYTLKALLRAQGETI